MAKGRFTVTNTRTMGQTARSTLGSLLGWSMAAALAYGGWTVWQWVKHERPYHQNEQRVTDAINQRDYDRAQALLAAYPTADFLRPEQRIDLEQRLRDVRTQETRSINLSRIDALIAAADIPGAQAQLDELVRSGDYPPDQLEPYRTRIFEHTEAGLFQSIQLRPKDRETLISRYLLRYPDGAHQSAVVQYALTDGVNALADALSSRADFDTVYGNAVKINLLFDTHARSGISITGMLSATELRSALGQYEESYVLLNANGALEPDTLVKIAPVADSYGLNKQFVAERDLNFPAGTLGTIIDTRKRDDTVTYLVRFSGTVPEWPKAKAEDWDMEAYWKRDQRIGEYFGPELRVAIPLTNTQKGQLRLEGTRLVASLSRLSQPLVAPSYGVNPTQ